MTATNAEPALKPDRPYFSSGPTAKFPGWSLDKLDSESLGRSHRSSLGKARLKYAIDLSRELLGVPDDYLVGIMPASDTGALECAMWTLLGADRPATVAAWESFGNVWIQDAVKQLQLPNLQVLEADYGKLPDFSKVPQGKRRRVHLERDDVGRAHSRHRLAGGRARGTGDQRCDQRHLRAGNGLGEARCHDL